MRGEANEAGLRANEPDDRLDLPKDKVEALKGEKEEAPETPVNRRSEGAEMAPEIDEVDGEE